LEKLIKKEKKMKILKTKIIVILSLFFMLVIFTGCEKKHNDVIKIGAIIPLTGKSASLGNLHKLGIELAVDEINNDGGINGKKVKLYLEDSQNEAKTGISVFNKLKNFDDLSIIICTFSNVCVPLSEYVKASNISDVILFNTATSAPDISIGADNIFRSFLIGQTEAKVTSNYIIDSLRIENIALYYVNDDFGLGTAEAFEKYLKQKGKGNIVSKDYYEITQLEHRPNIQKLKRSNPQAIFISGYGNSLVSLIKQLKELHINAEIFCTATFAIPDVYDNLGIAKDNIYFTSAMYDQDANFPSALKFKEKFNKKFPDFKDNYQSAATYTSVILISQAISKSEYNLDSIKENLSGIKNIETPLGILSMDKNGEAPFPVKLKKVVNSKPVTVFDAHNLN
jgi:branched-chain amino acid transport system substrate-binding protein